MKCWKRLLSFALAAVLCVGGLITTPVLPGPAAQARVTQSDIDALKSRISGVSDQIKSLESQLSEIKDDKASALKQKQYLDDQIALADQQIALTDDQIAQFDLIIADYDLLIAGKQEEISALEDKEAAQYKLFCRRVRAMEEQGAVSYLSTLFNSVSFADLLDNAMLIGEIMDYDNDVIDLLQATRKGVEDAKLDLEAEQDEQRELRAQQEEVRAQQEAQRAELEAKELQAAELVSQIASQEKEYQNSIKALEAEDARIQREIKEAQRQLELQKIPVVSESGFYWPIPGFYTLTSKFGWRIHPIYKTKKYHNGTDIGAAQGTPIGAAKSGVVTTSQYSSSYGHYVVLTHSDGFQTLYAHMTRRAVKVGDVVKQAQTIGYVGSTGASTGPHLHLEVWLDGVRKDAEQYYPDLPFKRVY